MVELTKPIVKVLATLLVAIGSVSLGFVAGNRMQGPTIQTITKMETMFRTVTEPARTIYVPTTVVLGMSSPMAGAWREIKRFSGSADMTTELFHVPAKMWRVNWSYGTSEHAYFSFWVCVLPEYSVESVSSSGPSGSSVTYIYKGPGDFYLKILVANVQYTIVIEAPT